MHRLEVHEEANLDWIIAVAERWAGGVIQDFSRYILIAGGAWLLLWVVFARLLAHLKIRRDRPRALQLLKEIAVSARTTAVFGVNGLLTYALLQAGWLRGPALAAEWGPLWAVLAFPLMAIGHDTYFYWTHRAMHNPRVFRSFHRRHHLSNNPSPFTALSFDIAEAVVQGLFFPIWLLLVPTPWWVVSGYFLMHLVRNALGHSGYEIFPSRADGRPMFDWLTTVTHHDLHHAQAGWNYGFYFTWWDRIMGTEHPEYHARFAEVARPALRLVS